MQILKDVPADQIIPAMHSSPLLSALIANTAMSNTPSIRTTKSPSHRAKNDGNDDHLNQENFEGHAT